MRGMKKIIFAFVVMALSSCFAQDLPDSPSPKTFDKQTIAELSFSAVGISADLVTTRLKVNSGFVEKNRIAAPFVKSNSGAIVIGVASMGSEIAAVYFLRNHRYLKHIAPLAIGGIEFGMAIRNQSQKIRLTPRG